MKTGVLMQPLLNYRLGTVRITYQTDPYLKAVGPIRSMQKYTVIALTTKGTDTLRPWFGTHLAQLPLMNMYNTAEVELFIRDEVKEATKQFFIIQNDDTNLKSEDIIDSIELKSISINNRNNIAIEIMFYPLKGDSISLSLEV
jgi:hypothetical protein